MDDLKKTLKYIWDRTSDFSQRADMLLLALSCTCALFGITLIASAARALASHTYVPVQIFAFVLGLILYYVFSVIDLDIIADRWILLLIFETVIMLLLIPFDKGGLAARIRNRSRVLKEEYRNDGLFMDAVIDVADMPLVLEYILDEDFYKS